MKKELLIITYIVLLIFIIIGAFLIWYYGIKPSHIYEFTLEDYTYYLEEFSSDKAVGPINNADEAREKGVAVLCEAFSEETVLNQKPFIVSCDQNTNSWKISGSLFPIPSMHGGVAHIIIDGSSGDVLAMWHTK